MILMCFFDLKKIYLAEKIGVAATLALKGLGPQFGQMGGPFGSTVISKTCFFKFLA